MAEALAFWEPGQARESRSPACSGRQAPPRHLLTRGTRCCLDIENEQEFVPLQNIVPGQARLRRIYNSTLSEAGVMGLRVRLQPRLCRKLSFCGKRSFGDFANVAQAR